MSRTATSTRYRSAFILFVLTSLLMQVQSTFACQMMVVGGPAQNCCCDDVPDRPDPVTPAHSSNAAPCCDFSLEISLNELKIGSAPLWPPTQLPDHDPPTALLIREPRNELAEIRRYVVDSSSLINPSGSGTQTYLATLRLRI